MNADRTFLVDPNLSCFDIKTYGQFLDDLDTAHSIPSSSPLRNHSQPKEQRDDALYGYLIRLVAAIIKDEPITLNDLAPSSENHDLTIAPPLHALSTENADEQAVLPVSDRIRNLRDQILGSKCKLTLFTSGTTGTPKPILQSAANLTRAIQISPKHQDDVWGLAYQPTKIAALQVLLQAICNGNTIVNLFGQPIAMTRELIREWSISHLSATPTYFRLIAADSSPFPMVRAVTVGGEVCDTALRSKLESLFPKARFRNVYASSEMGTLLHSSDDCFVVPETMRNFVLIRDGRLWIHQSLIAENLLDQCVEGYWDSGDEVRIVDEMPLRLRVTGRRTDWINVGGTKVNPHDVEKTLRDIPGVIDARVFGIANSVTGQLVAAELTVNEGIELDVASIRKELKRTLPSVAIPRIITIRDAITSTETLKKERQ